MWHRANTLSCVSMLDVELVGKTFITHKNIGTNTVRFAVEKGSLFTPVITG
jgi:hypothetical protein